MYIYMNICVCLNMLSCVAATLTSFTARKSPPLPADERRCLTARESTPLRPGHRIQGIHELI